MVTLQQATDSPVIEQTKALCHAMLEQPSFMRLKEQLDAFMEDMDVQQLYQELGGKQQYLVDKQSRGVPLTNEEVSEFEAERASLLGNPVAAGFIEVQKEMNKLQETVSMFIQKTFEMGRVPTTDEVEYELKPKGGCCGGGCGSGGGGCGSGGCG